MDSVIKTILYCYPYFDEVADGICELAFYKATSSHCNSAKTLQQIERVKNLYEDAKFLRRLKNFVKQALLQLTDYERAIIGCKYFKLNSTILKTKSRRTYYRQQQKAFEKIIAFAKTYGLSEKWFMKNCYQIHCMRNVYNRILKSEKQRQENLQKKLENKNQITIFSRVLQEKKQVA